MNTTPLAPLVPDSNSTSYDHVMIHANDMPGFHRGWGQILGVTQLYVDDRLRVAFRVGFIDGRVELWPMTQHSSPYTFAGGSVEDL